MLGRRGDNLLETTDLKISNENSSKYALGSNFFQNLAIFNTRRRAQKIRGISEFVFY